MGASQRLMHGLFWCCFVFPLSQPILPKKNKKPILHRLVAAAKRLASQEGVTMSALMLRLFKEYDTGKGSKGELSRLGEAPRLGIVTISLHLYGSHIGKFIC